MASPWTSEKKKDRCSGCLRSESYTDTHYKVTGYVLFKHLRTETSPATYPMRQQLCLFKRMCVRTIVCFLFLSLVSHCGRQRRKAGRPVFVAEWGGLLPVFGCLAGWLVEWMNEWMNERIPFPRSPPPFLPLLWLPCDRFRTKAAPFFGLFLLVRVRCVAESVVRLLCSSFLSPFDSPLFGSTSTEQ